MKRKEYFIVVRIFDSKNHVFDGSRRAIVKTHSAHEKGKPVRFTSGGETFYGDVIECVDAGNSNEICKMFNSLSDIDVLIVGLGGRANGNRVAADLLPDQ